MTASEKRKAFNLETVRTPDGPVTRNVFVPPTAAEALELETVRNALEARLAPARSDQIVKALAKLAVLYKPERSDAEWQVLYEAFCEDLAGFSAAHIGQAIIEHRRAEKWFPKIAEIRTRCLELQSGEQIRLRRVHASLTGTPA